MTYATYPVEYHTGEYERWIIPAIPFDQCMHAAGHPFGIYDKYYRSLENPGNMSSTCQIGSIHAIIDAHDAFDYCNICINRCPYEGVSTSFFTHHEGIKVP